jgi:putative ABC transport system substrate-binding protein
MVGVARRCLLISALGVAALPGPAALAQAPQHAVRVAFVYFGTRESALETGRYGAFVQGLRELGYVEGRNLVLDARFANGRTQELPALIADATRAKAVVVVATGSQVYRALLDAGSTLPVVVTVTVDPVAEGLAQSLAHPAGRFTGLTDTAGLLGPKQLELLAAAVPRLGVAAVLVNPDNSAHSWQLREIEQAAQSIGKRAIAVQARNPREIDAAFAAIATERAQALIVLGDTFFTDELRRIAQLTLAARLPAAHYLRAFAEAGGLLSYGADLTENFHRAATFVDKIAKGAQPGGLPFEQPTQYQLVLNLKTAKALGLSLPQSLLVRADRLVQ